MPTLTSLPCELVATVLQELDNVRHLISAILSCRHVYSSFQYYPGVQHDILRRQVADPLLLYSVSVAEASDLSTHPTAPSTQDLLSTFYDKPTELVNRLQTFTLPCVLKMGRLHDMIHSFADDFATDAWALLFQDGPHASDKLTLSRTEHIRFCRVLYQFELYVTLSRGNHGDTVKASQNECFFSRLPPWEVEQLGCVHDFLEKRFSQGEQSLCPQKSPGLSHFQLALTFFFFRSFFRCYRS